MTNLAPLYGNGQGEAQDCAKAREWYEKAADRGDARAMTGLGSLLGAVLGAFMKRVFRLEGLLGRLGEDVGPYLLGRVGLLDRKPVDTLNEVGLIEPADRGRDDAKGQQGGGSEHGPQHALSPRRMTGRQVIEL